MPDSDRWLREGCVYQIYPRSFQDSDGDGVGDLPGILRRLDHAVELGVSAIWLSPIHPSPQDDFGYDISDYLGVDPVFGDPSDLDSLIAACHARGLKVLLDGVFNHTSDRHPWFVASRSGRADPKRGWYLWKDARNGRPPNNWASTFGGSAWSWDAGSGQFYLHTFLPSQPDLNWRDPEVVDAVLGVMRTWYERGVDGFRLDVYNCYRKHHDLPDNPRRWHPGGPFWPYIGQHHVHDRDQGDLVEVLAAMRALADRYGAVLVGETMDENFRYDQASRFVGHGLLHQAFHFALLHSRWDARSLGAAIRRWTRDLGERWPTWVLSNHDFPRFPTRWGGGEARAKAALTLAITLRGTPYLYYGDELGLPDVRLRKHEIVDPPGKRFWPFFKGRDGARTPMPWDASSNAGFTSGAPWLPLHPDAADRSVASQTGDPDSVLETCRALLALRAASPALSAGMMTFPASDHPDVLTWTRQAEGERLRILVNTRPWSAAFALPERADLVFRTGSGVVQGRATARLDPDEAMILRAR